MTKATATTTSPVKDKEYIKGSIRTRSSSFGNFLSLSLNLVELSKHANEKGYVNFTIFKRQFESEYGDTHYACVIPQDNDEFMSKPDKADDVPFGN